MASGIGQKVNRTGLADVFGVNVSTVDSWVKLNCPADQKGGRGREWVFDTADVSKWLLQRARDDAGGQDTQDDAALDRRKKLAAARLAELDLAKQMGALAPVDHMERVWSRIVAETTSAFRGAFVRRVASQLLGELDEREFKRVLLNEIDTTLETLAKMDPTEDDDADMDADGSDDGS